MVFGVPRIMVVQAKPSEHARQRKGIKPMETETATVTICTDLLERIRDLVSQDMLNEEDLACILRRAEQMMERRRGAP